MNDIKIFAMGDFYFNSNCDERDTIDKKLANIISKHDIKFCNLEAPVTDTENKIYKAGPCLKQNEQAIKVLKNHEFNMVSIANNHMFDYGNNGIEDTIKVLNKYSIAYIGAGKSEKEAYHVQIKDIYGVKIGFIALSEWQFGVYDDTNKENYGIAWVNSIHVNEIIKSAKKKVDILIASIHAGAEDVPLPLKEWRVRYKNLIELGIDVIIGHHTHIAQGYEFYNDKLIIYSLGNSLFNYGKYSYEKSHSYAVSIVIKNKKEINLEIIPIMNKRNTLIINNKDNGKFINNLNKLNKILEDEKLYEEINRQQCKWLYDNVYERYIYSYTNTAYREGNILKYFLKRIKGIIFDLIKYKKNYKYCSMILYHLYKVESHRYVIQEALKNNYNFDNYDISDFKKLMKN